MKKIAILVSIIALAFSAASCDIDNASIVGDWNIVILDGTAYYEGEEVYNYDLLENTEIKWNFTDTDVVLSENAIDCGFEISGELLKKFLPDIEGWDSDKMAYSVKIAGEPYYIDNAKFKARLERI